LYSAISLKTDLLPKLQLVPKMVNLHNTVDDIEHELFPNGEYRLDVEHSHNNIWFLYIRKTNTNRHGKVEIIIEEDQQDIGVLGSVLQHGCVSRATMALIMDTLMARL
jgi:hypothetical protein